MKLLKYNIRDKSIYIIPSSVLYFEETNFGTQIYFLHDVSILVKEKIEDVVKDYVIAMEGK